MICWGSGQMPANKTSTVVSLPGTYTTTFASIAIHSGTPTTGTIYATGKYNNAGMQATISNSYSSARGFYFLTVGY